MKHEPITTAHALAITTGVIYVLCAAAVTILPELSMTVTQSWFHGIDLSKIGSWNITAGSFILGLVTSVTFSWVAGYLFAYIYNLVAKK